MKNIVEIYEEKNFPHSNSLIFESIFQNYNTFAIKLINELHTPHSQTLIKFSGILHGYRALHAQAKKCYFKFLESNNQHVNFDNYSFFTIKNSTYTSILLQEAGKICEGDTPAHFCIITQNVIVEIVSIKKPIWTQE